MSSTELSCVDRRVRRTPGPPFVPGLRGRRHGSRPAAGPGARLDRTGSWASCRDARQSLGILGKPGEMLERQSRGALVFAGDDQSCDLNDLAFTACCGSGLMLGVGEVLE